MRILHITPTYIPAYRYGGPIYSVHALCRSLAVAGHDVHVLTTSVDGPHDSDVPYDRPVDLDSVQIHYCRSNVMRRLYWSPDLYTQCNEMISGFDAVHLHSVFLFPTWAGARASRQGRGALCAVTSRDACWRSDQAPQRRHQGTPGFDLSSAAILAGLPEFTLRPRRSVVLSTISVLHWHRRSLSLTVWTHRSRSRPMLFPPTCAGSWPKVLTS